MPKKKLRSRVHKSPKQKICKSNLTDLSKNGNEVLLRIFLKLIINYLAIKKVIFSDHKIRSSNGHKKLKYSVFYGFGTQ